MSDATQEAVALAVPFEGFSATPYKDSTGIWTIGYGSTRDADGRPVTASTPPISADVALQLMGLQMRQALAAIHAAVHVPLTDEETAALEDFVYNVGQGNFGASTLLKLLNAGDYEGAAAQFARWNRAGGQVLAGLVRRRAAEAALFVGGIQDMSKAPMTGFAPCAPPEAPYACGQQTME